MKKNIVHFELNRRREGPKAIARRSHVQHEALIEVVAVVMAGLAVYLAYVLFSNIEVSGCVSGAWQLFG